MKDKEFYQKRIALLKGKSPFISTTDIAYQLILNDILSGELRENQKINQEDLVNLFSMSRTPIRDALIKLRADGYIEKNSRSGYHVYAIQLKDYVDFFEFRLILEPQAAYLAARNMSDAQLQLLQDNLNKYRKAIAEQDLPAVVSLDNQFHDTIIEGSNNAYLIEVFKIYQTKKMFFAQKLIRADRLRNMENKHFALYHALCNSDEEKACEIMRSHLSFYIKNLYGII